MSELLRNRSVAWLLLAAILVLATAARLNNLASESIWLDEAWTVSQAQLSFTGLLDSVAGDVHPPLHHLSVWAMVQSAGVSETAIRLPSVLFSVLAVWGVYLLAAALYDRPTGLAAAALLAASVLQIRYAQEARMYSLLAMLSVWATWLLVQLEDRGGRRLMLAYGLLLLLMVYTHVYAAFVIAAHGAYLLLRRPADGFTLKHWALVVAAVGVGFLPWLGVFIGQVERVQSRFWIPQPGLTELAGVWSAWNTGAWPLIIVSAALVTWLLISVVRTGSAAQKRALLLLGLCALLPVLVPFFASQLIQPMFYERYTITAAVAATVLVAAGAMALPGRATGTVIVLLMLTGWTLQARGYYSAPFKPDWRSAVAAVEAQAEPGDAMIFVMGYLEYPWRAYATRDDLPRGAIVQPEDLDTEGSTAGSRIAGASRVWLFRGQEHLVSFDPLRLEALLEPFQAQDPGIELQGVEIVLYERDPEQPPLGEVNE